jgi:hypothetical protein
LAGESKNNEPGSYVNVYVIVWSQLAEDLTFLYLVVRQLITNNKNNKKWQKYQTRDLGVSKHQAIIFSTC